MNQIQGVVESANGAGTGVKVGGMWHNSMQGQMDTQGAKKGDTVAFTSMNGQIQTGTFQITASKPPYQGGNPGGGGGRKQRTPQEQWGPIVGHQMLVAATALGPGADPATLVNYTRQLIEASEDLVNELSQRGLPNERQVNMGQPQQFVQQQQAPQQSYQAPQQGGPVTPFQQG